MQRHPVLRQPQWLAQRQQSWQLFLAVLPVNVDIAFGLYAQIHRHMVVNQLGLPFEIICGCTKLHVRCGNKFNQAFMNRPLGTKVQIRAEPGIGLLHHRLNQYV